MVIRFALLFLLTGHFLSATAWADGLRLILPDSQPVTGEMIELTIRGEYTRRITLETLTFPDSTDYDWMQLARDSWQEEQVNGLTAKVFERRIALFPRRAGPLTVGPVTHHLTLAGGTRGREKVEMRAEPVTIQVAPFPADSAPLAAKALTVNDELSVSPGELRDGETLIRRVTLRAAGTLPHLMPPRPVIREPWLISFTAPEQRETKPTLAGPQTTVVWEWHLRPKTGEPGVLPPIQIPWFDTVSRQMMTAEIPAIPFGYASFSANRTGQDQLPAAQLARAAAAAAAGLMTGLVMVFSALTRRRGYELVRRLKRFAPFDPTWFRLKAAAKQGDLMALRAATENYLSRRLKLGLPVREDATGDLDRAIYAKFPAPPPFNPKGFPGTLRRRNRARQR